jgi:uncharacterized protein DUF4863
MDYRARLLDQSRPLLDELKNRTPGRELEDYLNETYGPTSAVYQGLAEAITHGVEDGWAAGVEVTGPDYRRSRIHPPTEDTSYFSITAVYMNSQDVLRGEYHQHPYGEINMVVPLDDGAVLAGPLGWRGAGWTAPAPGSHHYPEVKGGAVIALFYLPAGRISYDIKPSR